MRWNSRLPPSRSRPLKKKSAPRGARVGRRGETPATRERPPDRGGLLHDFTVERQVEAGALDFIGDAQANRHVDDLQDDQRDDGIVDDDASDADALLDDLSGVALDEARVAAVFVDREDARQY